MRRFTENVQGDGEATENTENGEVKIHWIKAVIIHVTLILLLIAYSFIGAAIFKVCFYWRRFSSSI